MIHSIPRSTRRTTRGDFSKPLLVPASLTSPVSLHSSHCHCLSLPYLSSSLLSTGGACGWPPTELLADRPALQRLLLDFSFILRPQLSEE